jgi:hypothetical protein
MRAASFSCIETMIITKSVKEGRYDQLPVCIASEGKAEQYELQLHHGYEFESVAL